MEEEDKGTGGAGTIDWQDCDPETTGCMGDCGVPEHDFPAPEPQLVCAVCELPAGTCSHPANHVKEA